MPLELTTRRPAATMRVPLTDPETGEPTDAAVILAGPYSTAGIAAKRAARADLPEDVTTEALLDEVAIRSTQAFEGLTINGEPITVVDEAGVRALYAEFTWMIPQVRNGQWRVESFFEKPSASSTPTPDISASSASQ